MAFLNDKEFILFMDCQMNSGEFVSVDELKRLRQAGMQTAVHVYTFWDKFIQDGHPDWRYFDDYLERVRAGGMKALINLWYQESQRLNPDWYAHVNPDIYGDKSLTNALSPWCEEAQAHNREILRMVIKQYTCDDVQFELGQHENNERVLFNLPAYFDRHALADYQKKYPGEEPNHKTPEGNAWLRQSYIKLMAELMAIFVNEQPHREAWFNLSWYKAWRPSISCHGCDWIDDYLREWEKLKPASINHISFNYFPYRLPYWQFLRNKDQEWGINEFVGAEYCEGLKAGNGKLAALQGLRGMIVGPTHQFTGHEGIESWMTDEIMKTHRLFLEQSKNI